MDTLATEPDAATTSEPSERSEPKPLIATIGAASGAVRRSSGYAFQHIQQQISQLAAGIAQGNMAVPTPISSRLTAMDEVFNAVLRSRPDLSVSLYMGMARALNGDQFARFMLGQATVNDWLRVIAAMPKGPFIAQVAKQVQPSNCHRSYPMPELALLSNASLLAIAAILLIGVPHGGLDGAVARRVGWPSGLLPWALFHIAYLLLAASVAGLWWLFPLPSLIFFLVISALHFGSSDIRPISPPSSSRRWLPLIAHGGLVVIAIPVFQSSRRRAAVYRIGRGRQQPLARQHR